jgi:hypothetical protein
MEGDYNFTLGENTLASNSVITHGNSVLDTSNSIKENKFIQIFPEKKDSYRNSYSNIVKNKNKKSISNSGSEPKLENNYPGKKRNSSAPKNNNYDKQLVPQNKKEISTVKNTLYEALKNINKELNVKIEKKEQSKVSFSLMNFIDQDPDEILDSQEDEDIKNKKHDGYTKKMSKKVDIHTVLESITDSLKTQKNEESLNTKENIISTLPNNNMVEKKELYLNELDLQEIKNNNYKNNEKNKNFNDFQNLIDENDELENEHENVHQEPGKIENNSIKLKPINHSYAEIQTEFKKYEESFPEIFEELENEGVINNFQINQNSNLYNKSIISIQSDKLLDYKKLFELLKIKNEKIKQQQFNIDNLSQEIHKFKSLESKKKVVDFENNIKDMTNYIVKLEKENIILKNELGNSMKHKNIIIKKFNDELNNITKISQNFHDDFFSTEKNID